MPSRSEASIPPAYVNAYQDRYQAVFVRRDAEGRVRLHRLDARPQAYVRRADFDRGIEDAFRRDAGVTSVIHEQDWVRVVFRNRACSDQLLEAMETRGYETFEGDIGGIRRIVANHRVAIAEPRRIYLDIETDSRATFDQMTKGLVRVLSWSLADETGVKAVGCLDRDHDESEKHLLRQLWTKLRDYDQVIAWNGDGFDFPVIRNRSQFFRLRYEDGQTINMARYLWLDQMLLFQRMNMMAAKSGDEKTSLKLQDVATSLLGHGKDDFDASKTWEAWAEGSHENGKPTGSRLEMVRYMIKDTTLLPEIERETGYVKLLQTLCEVTGAFPDTRGMRPGGQVENYLLRVARTRGHRFRTNRRRSRDENVEKFRGAFVMEPTVEGIGRGVHVADFSKMYPSIIISWNMSPETKYAPAPTEEEGDGFCRAHGTKVCFRNEPEGILPAAIAEIMKLRGESKRMMKDHPPGSDEWAKWNRRSTAYKIATNSFYGVIGSPFARFFDREVAESVTQCGVWLIQETIEAAEKRGWSVVYGDTDSLFVSGCEEGEFGEFVSWCNEDLFPRLLSGRGCTRNEVELGYEKAFDRIVFTTAKRYAGRYLHYEGVRGSSESRPEVKGLEFKRGDSLKLARDFQQEVVHAVVGYQCDPANDPAGVLPIVERWKDRILNGELSIDDVAVTKRLSKPLEGKDAYKRKLKKNGAPARLPPHVEIAIAMKKRGEEVRVGTRVSMVCVDAATSPKKFVETKDAFDEDGKLRADRHGIWEDFVWPPTRRFLQSAYPCYDWSPWDRTRPKKPRRRGPSTAKEQTALFEAT